MSVTAVPIQPIKKGSVAKYWTGVAVVLLAGAGLAWWGTGDVRSKYASEDQFLADNAATNGVVTSKSGLQMQTLRGGEGKSPTNDDIVLVGYKGTLRDGTVFDQNQQAPMEVSGVVPGFSEALKKMQRGGRYKIWIPASSVMARTRHKIRNRPACATCQCNVDLRSRVVRLSLSRRG